jgi:hypothetical protein
MRSVAQIEMQARSESIRRSIRELDGIIADGELPPVTGPLREEYYEKLCELIKQEARDWYEMGFRRCHKVLFDNGSTTRRRVTKTMRMSSEYFSGVRVKLDSTIELPKKKKSQKKKRAN